MNLSSEQNAALDLSRPTSLRAGAGSGKTGVLIERYLLAIEDSGFDLDAVLAVTFTKKATAEVFARVRKAVTARIAARPAQAAHWTAVRERLSEAWILTIDAFCHRVLATMGPAAGLSSSRTILTGGALAEVVDAALDDVVDGIAADPADPQRPALARLLRAMGRAGLSKQLASLLQRRARAVPWSAWIRSPAGRDVDPILRALGVTKPANDLDREQHGLLLDLATVFERVLGRYRARLAAADGCDFRQLLEDVADQFTDARIRDTWARRFRHVLVDEFQDTDPVQWETFRALFSQDGLMRPGLFVVGDEKQAIFSFRDGDVATFRHATNEIAAAGGGLAMELADNYRSSAALVSFFNALSASIFAGATSDFEARNAPMSHRRDEGSEGSAGSGVELVVAHAFDITDARDREFHEMARRIRHLGDGGARVRTAGPTGVVTSRPSGYADIAVLLRRRTPLAEIEAALTAHGVPFRVLGGVGFFDRHEIQALRNLMRFLADDHDDLALLGVLRSALFGLADSVLLAAVKSPGARASASLWRRIVALHQAVGSGATTLPTAGDAPMLADAVTRLERYRSLADRLPGNELLALAVRESDHLMTLDVVDPSGRSGANVEKLLDLVRRNQKNGVATFAEVERMIALAVGATDDPEAQADPPSSRDAVSILTVHAAKGLEWPIVFVPDCSSDPLKGGEDDERVPARMPVGAAVPFIHAVKSAETPKNAKLGVDAALKERARDERLAELKRLLYVAVTRARDHLVLSGAVVDPKPGAKPKNAKTETWLRWIEASGAQVQRADVHGIASPTPRRGHLLLAQAHAPAADGAAVGRPAPAEPVLRIPATALSVLARCPRRYFLEQVIGVVGDWGDAARSVPDRDAPAAPRTGGTSLRTRRSAAHGSEQLLLPWSPLDDDAQGPPGRAAPVVRGPEQTDPTLRGSIIHAALEGIALGIDPVGRVRSVAASAGVRDVAEIQEIEEAVVRAIGGLRKWDLGAAILAPGADVTAEVPFDLGSGDLRVVGAIDLLFRPEAGGAVVVDFKTNREVPVSAAKARAFTESAGYGDQLRSYAVAAHRRFGGPVSAFAFFTETGGAVAMVGGGAEPIDLANQRVEALLSMGKAAALAGFPLTTESRECAGCPHRGRRCPGARNEAGQ